MAKKINIFTLGCSKNRVDSEVLLKQLSEKGFEVAHESENDDFDYVLINTCGFIGDAKEESIETILNFTEARIAGDIEKILVFGCLSERYKDELEKEIPEVDAWFGKFELEEMLKYLQVGEKLALNPRRIITTPQHYAFLKISEGCNRTCSYCAIPHITGGHTSKPMDEVVQEAKELIQEGVKEIILIAQDLSYYGIDLYKKQMLAPLMEELAQLPGLKWLRIHYTYPAKFPYDILPVMAKYPNICKYMDIALQHISDNMLKIMRRNVSKQETIDMLQRFRDEVPGITLRTTLLVGHPGETEKDFEELIDFVEEVKFDRLGVFPYSHEEDTHAYRNYKDDIPQEVKDDRAAQVMEVQAGISAQINQQKVGHSYDVLIDRKEGEFYVGRTQSDSPEVDGEVLVTSTKALIIGNFYQITITQGDEYDLYGKLAV